MPGASWNGASPLFNTITGRIQQDGDYPRRARELDILQRVLEDRLYDVLPHEFHQERTSSGEYIPLKDRRPCVRYNLSRLVVEDSVALLFSEGHFPTLACADHDARNAMRAMVKDTALPSVMTQAAVLGSVGSVAILMRVLKGRLFFDAMPTMYLTPEWRPDAPDTLLQVTEKYKVPRSELAAVGYEPTGDAEWWWFQRRWDDSREIWYHPWPVGKSEAGPVEDPARTVAHGLGFVPLVWIKNLPGPSSTGSPIDGAATFSRSVIATQIEIEYQLSQAGRGLKYASDPTLLVKEPAFAEQSEYVRTPANALVVSQQGDAKLLEINGTATAAVLEYARELRELALEQAHGNRAKADKLSAAQSGRAQELMHQALIWLADHLRQSYGERGLLPLLRMVAEVSRQMKLSVAGKPFAPIPQNLEISLRWPPWFQPTGTDRVEEANALATLRVAGLLSRETGVSVVAQTVDVEDVRAEITRIEADEKEILAGRAISPTGQPGGLQPGPKPNGDRGGPGDG